MEENAKAELPLSEEQLQTITGGSGRYLQDEELVDHHATLANAYNTIAEKALGKNKSNLANIALTNRDNHINAMWKIEDRIKRRKTTPGT